MNVIKRTTTYIYHVEKSEVYSKLLRNKRIEHEVLNAKNHEKEAEIIANAGRLTSNYNNKYLEGVDIQLAEVKILEDKKNI